MSRNGREVGMVVRRVRLEIAQVVGLRLSGLASGGIVGVMSRDLELAWYLEHAHVFEATSSFFVYQNIGCKFRAVALFGFGPSHAQSRHAISFQYQPTKHQAASVKDNRIVRVSIHRLIVLSLLCCRIRCRVF